MNHKDYVHYHIGFSKNKWIIFFNYFLGFFICLGNGFLTIIVLVVILNLITEETLPQSVLFTSTIIIGIIYFYYMIKSVHTEKTSYKIYEDRIEFFNERTPTIADVIPFSR